MVYSFLKNILTLHLLTHEGLASEVKEIKDSIQSLSAHPRVQASNMQIKMEVRGNHDYYGQLYVGSDYIDMRTVFDTMS